jgi:hypothetical protein
MFIKHKWFPELSATLIGLVMTADPGTDDSTGGGSGGGKPSDSAGGDGGAGDADAEFEKHGGLETLRKLRSELKERDTMIKTFQNRIDPEQFAKVKREAEEYQRRITEQESHMQLKLKEQEDSFSKKLSDVTTRAQVLEKQLDTVLRRSDARDIWSDPKVGGREDQFEAFWKLHGDERLRRDESGKLFVADEKGTPLLGEDGKRVDPAAWVVTLQDDPIMVHHFKPTVGSGSGSQGGRSVGQGRENIHGLGKNELFNAFND